MTEIELRPSEQPKSAKVTGPELFPKGRLERVSSNQGRTAAICSHCGAELAS